MTLVVLVQKSSDNFLQLRCYLNLYGQCNRFRIPIYSGYRKLHYDVKVAGVIALLSRFVINFKGQVQFIRQRFEFGKEKVDSVQVFNRECGSDEIVYSAKTVSG